MSLPCQRHLFSVPDEVAFFNCATNSPQLNAGTQALHEGVDEKRHPWNRTPDQFFDRAETLRLLASQVFGGAVDDWALIPAASYGLTTAARAIAPTLKAGDVILGVAEEFPSNVFAWRRVAHEVGAQIRTVPWPADGDWSRAIIAAMDARTRVLAMSTCHWTNGARIDLVAVARAARAQGCTLVVDATQSLGVMPFEMDEVQPDFLVAAGYKWLLFPYGLGLMRVAPRWQDAMPLEESWLGRDNARDFRTLAQYSEGYMPGARRFDVGEKCTPTLLPGGIAALTQIQRWGVPAIAQTLAAINAQVASGLEALGFTVPPAAQRCPHLFGALMPKGCSLDLVGALARQKIYITQRGEWLRISPHLHVNQDDIARLLGAVAQVLKA